MALDGEFPEVVAAAKEGAEWALACLYRDLQPSLLGYLRARDAREAEDLASETWVSVARSLPSFVGDESGFRAWVFTIARRRVIDLRRHDARRPATAPIEGTEPGPPADAAETEAIGSVVTAAALAVIATLPPVQAEIVLLRVVAGLSADEVAKVVGKRAGTVRVLQHRALRRLAAQLADRDGTER
ncbi:MAG: polymerase sigma-70 factor, subfamily [Acidimicrobiaceae bacterium]|jgi:RNA polymerase sigma-70 factor (ECF subfamily)|nr:polymerase sigma-70 factor, subfamily [Acidimicrobiaceae bacterium]